jgi:hypothetical protein
MATYILVKGYPGQIEEDTPRGRSNRRYGQKLEIQRPQEVHASSPLCQINLSKGPELEAS